ncbi:MAG TPA: zinc ribbon domain-containing protein [Pyrinomonadaceae bacterium]
MFCPKCGVKNVEDAKFCRACGADISLVPQALTRSLPEGAFGMRNVGEEESEGGKKRRYKPTKPPTLEKGLSKCMEGVAFLLIFLTGYFYFFGAFFIWIWLIIPALANFGEGVGQIIRARSEGGALPPRTTFDAGELTPPAAHAAVELPQRATSEIVAPPPSVTEGTTRHLGAAGPAKR